MCILAGKPLFATSQEFYDYIHGLMERLKAAGEPEWANAFGDILIAGFTGHEVVGNILLKMKEFQASGVPAKLGMQDEIGKVRKDLKRALRRW